MLKMIKQQYGQAQYVDFARPCKRRLETKLPLQIDVRIGRGTEEAVALGLYKYPRESRALVVEAKWTMRLYCPSAAPVLWPVGTVWHWCGTVADSMEHAL
jgi:hypothetical protein